ncbi:hypothetical protein ILUMI_13166 [Ignelater luminosus]|uniref:LITAF domain-containing protein n=1 Tax=Ignelater luminosus TaxID=2038154 RepID=A0A8K0G632_IGNLU|nr:hypothetical protein ILUMI_13166 [Ignelater luminosus]
MTSDKPTYRKYWCPKCQTYVLPTTQYRLLTGYKLLSYLLCFFGSCLLPYAIPSCRKEIYYCPNCHDWIDISGKQQQKEKKPRFIKGFGSILSCPSVKRTLRGVRELSTDRIYDTACQILASKVESAEQ